MVSQGLDVSPCNIQQYHVGSTLELLCPCVIRIDNILVVHMIITLKLISHWWYYGIVWHVLKTESQLALVHTTLCYAHNKPWRVDLLTNHFICNLASKNSKYFIIPNIQA